MLRPTVVAALGAYFVAYAFWPPREHVSPSLFFALIAFASAYRLAHR